MVLVIILMILLSGCSKDSSDTQQVQNASEETYSGDIYLYGERHGDKEILEKEFEIWKAYYENHGMRHLFIEMPYYSAEFLNLWMKADDDAVLMELYDDSEGTAAHNVNSLEFYRRIKKDLPETIFYGTDVGHQYSTTGVRYLEYLESVNLKDTEAYKLTEEAIEQGRTYYQKRDGVYRENKMVENFIRALGEVNHASIMGIYGNAHTGLDAMVVNTKVAGMAKQLMDIYGSQVYSEDLTILVQVVDPISVSEVEILGESYEASYFGKQDLTGFNDLAYREVWRLEDAYNDFKYFKRTGDVLPFYNYPMLVEVGQVFMLDYGKTDGTVTRMYYISDGTKWNNHLSTVEVKLED